MSSLSAVRVLDSVVVGHIFESLVWSIVKRLSTTEPDSWPPPIVVIGFMRCLSRRVDSALATKQYERLLVSDWALKLASRIIASEVHRSTLVDPMHYPANEIQAAPSAITLSMI